MTDTAWEKCIEHTYGKNLFVVYLKFTFSWVSFIYLFILLKLVYILKDLYVGKWV